jgi:hypothetical protein
MKTVLSRDRWIISDYTCRRIKMIKTLQINNLLHHLKGLRSSLKRRMKRKKPHRSRKRLIQIKRKIKKHKKNRLVMRKKLILRRISKKIKNQTIMMLLASRIHSITFSSNQAVVDL